MINKKMLRSYGAFLEDLDRSSDHMTMPHSPEELFSTEHLERYAADLASEFEIRTKLQKARSLVPELKRSRAKLESAYKILAAAIQDKETVSPAAEWFVDNYFVIESQLKEINLTMPADYYAGLPQLAGGSLEGYPRVYGLALAIIAHTDSRLDASLLQKIISSFQTVAPLQIGEIWALGITLRIVLVQHLTPLADRIVKGRKNRKGADRLADQILEKVVRPGAEAKDLTDILAKQLGSPRDFKRSTIVQLIQRLRDQEPNVLPAFDWLQQQLKVLSTDVQQVTQLEHHLQASSQVTVGNIIGSMRMLSSLDWRDFFEEAHLGERILRQDPAGIYPRMDFRTRDSYRHSVERLSKRSEFSEEEVVERAVELSSRHESGLKRHLGYFLIGDGKYELEKICHYKVPLRERLSRSIRKNPTAFYFSILFIFTVSLLIPLLSFLAGAGEVPWRIFLLSWLAVFPASELAISLLNHYVHFFIKPQTLPRMDLEKGIPPEAATIVVIPTLFLSKSGVRELVERIEIHYLANQDSGVHFALLSDFADAATETTPIDKALILEAEAGIWALNQRYHFGKLPHFHLFHRKRLWNPSENQWMGWERKRGKLLEFNRLLRGSSKTSYEVISPVVSDLAEVQYVIVLDSDTLLPRDAVQKLVGTMTHPLNQPVYDAVKGRVVSGYGVLQPRISITSSSANATRFSRISSGNVGLDPYTTAVSDLYQDLFAEGSFSGKGLYVLDAFERALEQRVPENTVLSHDLFEGSFARAALVTDVELYDDYPSDFDKYTKRNHRWIRGDWQIAPWLLPYVPNEKNERVKNSLSLISRWKIFDNLRRSLVPIATLLWLILAWTTLPGSPLLWTAFIALMYLFPVYSTVITGQWMSRRGLTWRGYFDEGKRETQLKLSQILLTLTFLPQQAWTSVDAILRSFYRKFISKQNMLEWTSQAQVESRIRLSLSSRNFLSAGPLFGLFILITVVLFHPNAAAIALPFVIVWVLNPLIKDWLSARPPINKKDLTLEQQLEFRSYGRLTWHFFETFLNEKGHWLAPDNFQEDPKPVIANRTSPTNIGLQLLSSAAAYDLGYIGRVQLIEMTEKTFGTLQKLTRINGHFFNWYDTFTLEALQPCYVSTVDSGNLAGHLITFRQFLIELQSHPQTFTQIQKGLADTVSYLVQFLSVESAVADQSKLTKARQIFEELYLRVEALQTIDANDRSTKLQEISIFLQGYEFTLLGVFSKDSAEENIFTEWKTSFQSQINEVLRDQQIDFSSLKDRELDIANQCDQLVAEMDFRFLYDEKKKLFVIGFNVNENKRDVSNYDLLASESRLASFVAIAKGDVPGEHWFRLGRKLAPVNNGRVLIAWTATMFEYLMPTLVMRVYNQTLLAETYDAVVRRQIEYGIEKGAPWGVSEAGFNARDLQMNYQYGPFGIPGLGLKRGLSDELVVSPYSTFLAAFANPVAALKNLKKLTALGGLARYGFYESLDFTAERVPKNQKFALLRSFMAHHQGMSLVAISNLLTNNRMQSRFHADPMVQAAELLLQERIPQVVALSRPRSEEIRYSGFLHSFVDMSPRLYSDAESSSPRVQILSNGTYTVLLTAAGSGYSRSAKTAVTRWREDSTRDQWGQYYYIRDLTTKEFWSATHQSVGRLPVIVDANFAEDRVEFVRQDASCTTRTEIIVSPEDNVELRRISITNKTREEMQFEITSFMEVVLAKPEDDAAHPAFSNLFVQTEYIAQAKALLATRRLRTNTEKALWGFHTVATEEGIVDLPQYETDRAKFLGRGRSAREPYAIEKNQNLSNTVGSVLDPIFCLRQKISVKPGQTSSVTFATGTAVDREQVMELTSKYRDPHIFRREGDMAWTQSQVQLRHLGISVAEAHTFQKLAGRVLYIDSSLRASSQVLAQNTRAQSDLWAYGISGDLPIILTRISDEQDMLMVRELLRAHEYFRLKGLKVDLVILNERPTSYLQALQDELIRQIRMSGSQALLDKPGGVFLRRTDLMPASDVILLRAIARVTLSADRGPLAEQLRHRRPRKELPEPLLTTVVTEKKEEASILSLPELQFFNGLGGFTSDNKEYVIALNGDQTTPAPWINVIANENDFGCLVSESGSGYTWSVNSRENRLTPWSNDPVSDPSGEAFYIRDEESGEFWSPTPHPVREKETYLIRHGHGYSAFEHTSHNIGQTLEVFVALKDNVKLSRLTVKNLGFKKRKLSLTSYVEWVLGFQRQGNSAFIIPEIDTDSGAMTARNPYNNEFASKVAFTNTSEAERSFTCDRREFIGRNGNLKAPAALKRTRLSGLVAAGTDPCAALQTFVELAPGEEKAVVFILGQADTKEQALALATKYRDLDLVQATLVEVQRFWDKTLSAIEVVTPDASMNTLMNRWLLYQTLACRLWARSAFYQSGGAFGFRDQLQDVMALAYSQPELARKHILKAAARQFPQGDVQHWWHPPTGRGVRTRFSDDLIWLAFVVSHYIKISGDLEILKEEITFIEAEELPKGVDDVYSQPQVSGEKVSLFEHCARALDRSLKVGVHGLPFMGSGDWNDGMSRVGHEGQGESVWVAWFLYATLEQFKEHCRLFAADQRLLNYQEHLVNLKAAIEENAWDGQWYRRAYFDDGTPLGSRENAECQIDAIAQSWAVLSKAGDPVRAKIAMASVEKRLVREDDGLIQLFDPPFDKTTLDPGYIKGYLPGVRENGGQYTHAAIWTLMAYAELGDGDRATELYALLNPINHSLTMSAAQTYKVEPYVIAADVYGMAPHIGRGGWTWYTGSASWMYRAGLESILGFEVVDKKFRVRPQVPKAWNSFKIFYQFGSTKFNINCERGSESLRRIRLDGVVQTEGWILMVNDGREHLVEIEY